MHDTKRVIIIPIQNYLIARSDHRRGECAAGPEI